MTDPSNDQLIGDYTDDEAANDAPAPLADGYDETNEDVTADGRPETIEPPD